MMLCRDGLADVGVLCEGVRYNVVGVTIDIYLHGSINRGRGNHVRQTI